MNRVASAGLTLALLQLACGGEPAIPDAHVSQEPTTTVDDTCDGVDDDGDGTVDEAFEPIPSACGVGACTATGFWVCIDGALADDCLPDDPLYEDDNCDGHDDDCDGRVDEHHPRSGALGHDC